MNNWEKLNKGDIIDILASASYSSDTDINKIKSYIESLGLIPRISFDINKPKNELIDDGYDPFCSNTDDYRLEDLKKAINSDSKAIWQIRGGYGSMRLISSLIKMPKPENSKLFIGFSDITALHLFFQKYWNWPTIHADTLNKLVTSANENIKGNIEDVIFGRKKFLEYEDFMPKNTKAQNSQNIEGKITGGNLRLVETSIGTDWQIDCNDKILFLEDIGERGYSVDRMLEHLVQAKILNRVKAVIFGNFTESNEKDGTNHIDYAINRFAKKIDVPVISTNLFGHSDNNYPLPLNTDSVISISENIKLKCETGLAKEHMIEINNSQENIKRNFTEAENQKRSNDSSHSLI